MDSKQDSYQYSDSSYIHDPYLFFMFGGFPSSTFFSTPTYLGYRDEREVRSPDHPNSPLLTVKDGVESVDHKNVIDALAEFKTDSDSDDDDSPLSKIGESVNTFFEDTTKNLASASHRVTHLVTTMWSFGKKHSREYEVDGDFEMVPSVASTVAPLVSPPQDNLGSP